VKLELIFSYLHFWENVSYQTNAWGNKESRMIEELSAVSF
jgi:hypothetical protein